MSPSRRACCLQLRLVRARAGDEEAHPPGAPDDLRQRVERELKALLVDEPADEQHEALVGRGEARAQLVEVADGLQVGGVDPVRDHRDPPLVDLVDVGDVAAHVVRARDDVVGAARHPGLDAVDVGLRVLVDPALVAAVLGGVDRREVRAAQPLGEPGRRAGDEPVVAVDDVEAQPLAELAPGGVHVRVHPLDPGDERVEVARHRRLGDAVDVHAAAQLLRRRARAPPRVSTWTSTPCATSASESLWTWRARPPATIGGYSHERMRMRGVTGAGGPAGPPRS